MFVCCSCFLDSLNATNVFFSNNVLIKLELKKNSPTTSVQQESFKDVSIFNTALSPRLYSVDSVRLKYLFNSHKYPASLSQQNQKLNSNFIGLDFIYYFILL